MKALVTGSNGFIGSHLVERLVNNDFQVRCLVRKSSSLRWIKNLPVEFIYGDVIEHDSVLPSVIDVDYVYHLGGAVRAKREQDFFLVNGEGTKNLLEACKNKNPNLKRFIYISTQAAAGPSMNGVSITEDDPPRPISIYGKSKQLGEQMVLQYQKIFPVTVIRPPAVYGPRDDDFLTIFQYIKFGLKPLIGSGEKRVSLIFIHDLIRGIHTAAEHPQAENEIFFIANNKSYSWMEVENVIANIMDKKTIAIRFPEVVFHTIAAINEIAANIFGYPAIINRDKAIEMKQNFWLVDASKAEQKLGFVTEIPLETGLIETYQWYLQQNWL